MDELIAFLNARLDDEEAVAREAIEEVGDGHWKQRNCRIVTVADDHREVADYGIVECIEHIVRHDPARVLADVAAKRQILAQVASDLADDAGDHTAQWMLRQLAAPYADHAEFHEDWQAEDWY